MAVTVVSKDSVVTVVVSPVVAILLLFLALLITIGAILISVKKRKSKYLNSTETRGTHTIIIKFIRYTYARRLSCSNVLILHGYAAHATLNRNRKAF